MSEQIIGHESTQPPTMQIEESVSAANVPSTSKAKKKKLAIISVAVIALMVITLILVFPSKFERVQNKCVQIAGMAQTGDGYFKLDTLPDIIKGSSQELKAEFMNKALEAIQYANKELGFAEFLYEDMIHTTPLMGVQRTENEKYWVFWSFYPDEGLEVTYQQK